jgi:hypothetical protein
MYRIVGNRRTKAKVFAGGVSSKNYANAVFAGVCSIYVECLIFSAPRLSQTVESL